MWQCFIGKYVLIDFRFGLVFLIHQDPWTQEIPGLPNALIIQWMNLYFCQPPSLPTFPAFHYLKITAVSSILGRKDSKLDIRTGASLVPPACLYWSLPPAPTLVWEMEAGQKTESEKQKWGKQKGKLGSGHNAESVISFSRPFICLTPIHSSS